MEPNPHKRGPKPGRARSVSIEARISGNNQEMAAFLAAELDELAKRIRQKWNVTTSCTVEAPCSTAH